MKSKLIKNFGNGNSQTEQQKEMQRRLQEVQVEMQKKADEIENMEFKATYSESGVDILEVVAKGDKSLLEVKILKKDAFSKDDSEKFCDLVVSTANKAFSDIDKTTDNEIAKLTKGLPIPGLMRN